MSSSRVGLRFLHTSRLAFRSRQQQIRQSLNRRWQSTEAPAAAAAAAPEQAGFAKFWNSPIGPKTVHFW